MHSSFSTSRNEVGRIGWMEKMDFKLNVKNVRMNAVLEEFTGDSWQWECDWNWKMKQVKVWKDCLNCDWIWPTLHAFSLTYHCTWLTVLCVFACSLTRRLSMDSGGKTEIMIFKLDAPGCKYFLCAVNLFKSLDEVLARRTKNKIKNCTMAVHINMLMENWYVLFQMIKYVSLEWIKQLNLFNERNHFYDITLLGKNWRFGSRECSCVWVCWHFLDGRADVRL